MNLAWFSAFIGFIVARYAFYYQESFRSVEVPTLLAGLAFGKVMALWARGFNFQQRSSSTYWVHAYGGYFHRTRIVLFSLVATLMIAALWQPEMAVSFRYHGALRWVGAWKNPNVFGLLMGVGTVLAVGLASGEWMEYRGWRRVIWIVSFCMPATLCGFALFKSYSRGAWLGTFLGLGYVVTYQVRRARIAGEGKAAWLCRNWRSLFVGATSVMVLSFWQFRFSEWRPMQRLFSVANLNDFSWRNRITAWHGALHMVIDRPLFGFGWAQAEAAYDHNYRAMHLDDVGAIQVNDLFTLAISAGVPALICLVVFLWISFRAGRLCFLGSKAACARDETSFANTDGKLHYKLALILAICRAGAVVLLVGFCFDGALFKLATGSVFWVLLELGREIKGTTQVATTFPLKMADDARETGDALKRSSLEIWLRRVAWALALGALFETTVLLATPFFPVNNETLTIARKWLIPPSAIQDLDFLARTPEWDGKNLRILLQHASLANYNRQLINWKLDDEMYRDYVLNPLIDPQRDGRLAWRRELWENFYLPMRKESNATAAAEIVMKFLHERIVVVSAGPATIEEMWRAKRADESGIHALEVAVCRSVGIPARIAESGRTEIFSEGKWKTLLEYRRTLSEFADGA